MAAKTCLRTSTLNPGALSSPMSSRDRQITIGDEPQWFRRRRSSAERPDNGNCRAQKAPRKPIGLAIAASPLACALRTIASERELCDGIGARSSSANRA